jgi:hypothetical protein
MRKLASRQKFKRPASGFILLLIILSILTIGAVTVLIALSSATTSASRRLQLNAADTNTLQAAKQALIGYSLNPPASLLNIRPGMLPTPDSLANASYDGKEDLKCLGNTANGLPAVGANSTLKRCLGKFPWKDIGLDVGNPASYDPPGEVPWLAVSANLVSYDSCLSVLNSDVANLNSPATPSCSPGSWPYAQPTVLPHPWLSVYDQNGNLLSDKVAAVLIMPGGAITTETRGQSRTTTNPGNPSDYLDSINLPLGCATGCTVFDNAGLNNKFVMIAPGTRYPGNADNIAARDQLIPFNDNLIYVTVDELIYYVERRVVSEMAKAMQDFKARPVQALKTYPWLQPLAATFTDSTSLYSQVNTTFGAFPFLMKYDPLASYIPSYRTDFSWSVSSISETNDTGGTVPICIQVNAASGNNRWMKNPLAGALNGTNLFSSAGPFNAGVASVLGGTCKWLGGTKLTCVNDLGALPTKTMTLWSSQNLCDANSAVTVGTLDVSFSRKISLTSTLCSSASVNTTYSNASSSATHRWNFACSVVSGEPAITIQDTISTGVGGYNLLPKAVSVASNPGVAHAVSVTDMRYAPIMPTWFYDNRWYLMAFAAIAPVSGTAPATPIPNPCGSATSLNLGGASGINAIVMVSGKKLSAQARPSNLITDYLEGLNASGGTTCNFANGASLTPAVLNDSLLTVKP